MKRFALTISQELGARARLREMFVTIFLALISLSLFAQAPRLLPFQGKLVDSQGKAISNGTKLVQFQIYKEPIGGNALWAGEVHRCTIANGMINVVLGAEEPFPENQIDSAAQSFWDQPVYLQVTIDSDNDNQITFADPPLLPRQPVLPVVFASESDDARKLLGEDWDNLANEEPFLENDIPASDLMDGSVAADKFAPDFTGYLVPKGAIMMWSDSVANIPPGWALCDGTGNTPDLRDRFVVGEGSSYTIGTTNTTLSHSHDAGTLTSVSHVHTFSGNTDANSSIKCQDERHACVHTSPADNHSHSFSGSTSSGGGVGLSGNSSTENCVPPFFALAFIIKL